ncbi:MAG TPA: neutral/alkaline non-lysosomal ceramidase N-terminal domain-containing protein, partial [Egibacteraceae bacterium]|nr:neutral/alkaline non-lysosomal ceramidase N-terminal domain-containing protein [Egibacteraceae bacterium]
SGGAAPVAIFTNGTEGDLIPRADECNQHACADRLGLRVAAAMRQAWDAAGANLAGDLPVAGAARRVRYDGQELEPGKRVARRAWFGLPFVGGAANGPHFLYGFVEGRRRPRALAGPVHGRKLLAMPAPWSPAADVTVLRVGDRLLLGVPGEPSLEAGRRMCAAALEAGGGAAGTAVAEAMVVGLAQGYRGYFTTPEEYDQQHYEGGHTVFGKHTSLLVQQAHAELAAELCTAPLPLRSQSRPTVATIDSAPAAAAPVSIGGAAPRILREPPDEVMRFDTMSWSWSAPPLGRARPVDAPYLVLERLAEDGAAEAVEDDLGTGFVWEQRGGRVTGWYEVPGDLPPGRYRFAVRTVNASAVTRAFTVGASAGLLLLGVAAEQARLVFRAQNPPPDPLASLRARERSPSGGVLRFCAGGRELEAVWDEAAQGWAAEVGDVPAEVTVPEGGLRDAAGNRSGGAVALTVGQRRPLQWPPPMGPGGGRCPAPFGRGPAGKPAAWRPTGG